MSGESSLGREVRLKLERGTPPEDVIQELTARGLTAATAQRFVDRALSQMATSAPAADGDSMPYVPPPHESRTVRNAVIIATALLVTTAVIVIGVVSSLGWRAAKEERDARAADARRQVAADLRRAAQVRDESDRKRKADEAVDEARREEHLKIAFKDLRARSPMTQCDAAERIGRIGRSEHAGVLVQVISESPEDSVRGCAAHALVDLGRSDIAMETFVEWARGGNMSLRRSGDHRLWKSRPAGRRHRAAVLRREAEVPRSRGSLVHHRDAGGLRAGRQTAAEDRRPGSRQGRARQGRTGTPPLTRQFRLTTT